MKELYDFIKIYVYKDSLKSIEIQKIELQTNYEISQKQIEVDLLNQQKQIKDNTNILFDISFFSGIADYRFI
jgi:hypothetical protein